MLPKKERQDETQLITKIDGLLSFISPLLNANVLFLQVFVEPHPLYDEFEFGHFLHQKQKSC